MRDNIRNSFFLLVLLGFKIKMDFVKSEFSGLAGFHGP